MIYFIPDWETTFCSLAAGDQRSSMTGDLCRLVCYLSTAEPFPSSQRSGNQRIGPVRAWQGDSDATL